MIAKYKKSMIITIAVVALLLGGLGIANIRIAVPPEYQGSFEISGKILNCDFSGLSKHSSKFFVGIVLQDSDKIFRLNPLHRERKNYETLCENKTDVLIKYHAVKRLVGPIRFWVDSVNTI